MKIAVVGPGAIGGLVAGYLYEKGTEVFLVGRKGGCEHIRKHGLSIRGVRGEKQVQVPIEEGLPCKVDLVICAMKTQDIPEFLEANRSQLKNAPMLTTQNGLYAEEFLSRELGSGRIVSSIVMFGATSLRPGEIIHNFEGIWVLGKYPTGYDDQCEQVAQVLRSAFTLSNTKEIQAMKWVKVFVNANNCIPAILGKSIQESFRDESVGQLGIRIWIEGLQIVQRAGVQLASLPDFPVERIFKLTSLPIEESGKIFSGIMQGLSREPLYGSILQSIKRGRPTEIDYMNGAFVSLAAQHKLNAPLNAKLVALVHRVERTKNFLTTEELLAEVQPGSR